MVFSSEFIKQAARDAGFDLCGICSVRSFDAEKRFFDGWLERGQCAGMEYLRRNVDKRFDPSKLVPGATAAIACAVSYRNDSSLRALSPAPTPRIASYARSRDYHLSVKEMLHDLAARIADRYGTFSYRAFTDSAPLAEKLIARQAGLGFIGRNTLLVSPALGSFMLLGEIVGDFRADTYDTPYEGPGCGECRRCVESCPAGALTPDGIDARLCISRRTVEKPSEGIDCAADTHGWIFGCDVCQAACPYNSNAPAFRNPRFEPHFDPADISRTEWLAMDEAEFTARFADTPLSRSSLQRIKDIVAAAEDD